MASACNWVVDNLSDGDRVIVDDAIWVDLVEDGLAPQALAGYGAVGAGPDWRSYRYIVSTPALRDAGGPPEVARAVGSSLEIASVGEGDERVEVRRIVASAPGAPAGQAATRNDARAVAGQALAANPGIEAPPAAVSQLRAGEVDERL